MIGLLGSSQRSCELNCTFILANKVEDTLGSSQTHVTKSVPIQSNSRFLAVNVRSPAMRVKGTSAFVVHHEMSPEAD